MARIALDATNNASLDAQIAAIEANFVDLYTNDLSSADPTVNSITTVANAVIGTTLAVAGKATVESAAVDTGTKTAAATSNAATLAKSAGVITTEALSTAAGAEYLLTLTNSKIAATDQVFASVSFGSSTTGIPVVADVAPGAGSVAIKILNAHATAAFNGTLKIAFHVLKN